MDAFEREDAKIAAAISDIASRARGEVLQGASLPFWTRRHPWTTGLIAFLGGFVVGEKLMDIMKVAQNRKPCEVDASQRMGACAASNASRIAHGSVELLSVGIRAGIHTAFDELSIAATRIENWLPPD